MHLTFAEPQALILLLALPVFALLALRLLDTTPGARLALALRVTQVALIVLALARPILSSPNQSLAVVYAIDRSDSLSQAERDKAVAWVNAALASRPSEDRAGVVVFGSEARVVRPLSQSSEPIGPLSPDPQTAQATDISAGLRLASSLFLPTGGKRIVLLSDGLENSGQALAEARQLAAQDVQVDFIPIGQIPDPEVLVDGIDAATYVRQGEPLDVSISVQSSRDQAGSLKLWADDELTLNQQVQLRAGPNRFTTTLTSLTKGFHAFRARIDGTADTFSQNNEDFAFSVVKDPARVALVASSAQKAEPLRSLLVNGGVHVDVMAPAAIPPSFGPLNIYDGLVLADVPASSLTLDQMKTIQGFVESLGRGLFVVGGADSYGAGGYDGTALADLLPVKVRAPARIDQSEAAVLLVLDKSGSMDERTDDGTTKIQATRDAAMLAADALGPKDYFGVLAFDTDQSWLIQMRQVGNGDLKTQLSQAVSGLEASGGTEIYAALEAAYNAMRGVPARFRYIVLVSDGVSFTNGDWDGLASKMQASGITLSTIAVGGDADQDLMKRLADNGGGRFHYTNRATDIPKLAVRETQLAAGAPTVEGDIEPQVKTPSPILRALPTDLPMLTGQAASTARDGATIALASQRDDPILAHWQRGLGRVAAWLSDGGATWAESWAARPDLARFWSQAVRWTLPTPLTSGLYVKANSGSAEVSLSAEAVDDSGSLLNLLDLRAIVGTDRQVVPLTQVSPGQYEARFVRPEQGVYPVEVVEYRGGQPSDHREMSGLVVSYPPEYRKFGPDLSALNGLASAGRGEGLGDPVAAYGPSGVRLTGETHEPLWPWLAMIALLLFPLDVGIRRLRVDHTFARRSLERLRLSAARLRLGRR